MKRGSNARFSTWSSYFSFRSKYFLSSSLVSMLCVGYFTRSDCQDTQVQPRNSKLTLIHVDQTLDNEHWDNYMKGIEATYPSRPIYALFLADIPSDRTTRWCKDCVIAEPIIYSVFEEMLPDAILVIFSVSRAPYKAPGYTYAINPSIQLTCVPTLMRFTPVFSSTKSLVL